MPSSGKPAPGKPRFLTPSSALYGKGSGEDREDGKSLRAAAASPDLETRVELEFVCGGKTYTILRKPTQSLTGERGKDLVEYKGSVVLILPDGSRKTDGREVDGTSKEPGLIERDILGVTRDQFCQTVMIAQGEFRKLLRAKTDERTEILRRIFRTQRFDALARRMEQMCHVKQEALRGSRKQISTYLTAMQAAEGSPLADQLAAMRRTDADELLLQDASDLADALAEADREEHREIVTLHQQAAEERDLAKQALDRALDLQKKRESRAALGNQLGAQKKDLEKAGQEAAEAEGRQGEIAALGERITSWGLDLPRYAELKKLRDECAETEKALKQAGEDRERAEKAEAELKKKREALKQEAESLADAGNRKLAATQALRDALDREKQLDTLDRRNQACLAARKACKAKQDVLAKAAAEATAAEEALAALTKERDALGNTAQTLTRLEAGESELKAKVQAVSSLEQLMKKLEGAGRDLKTAREECRKLEEEWKRTDGEARLLRSRYNASIAGLWARDLQEGLPCPVCGSVHHPAPAALSGESATEEQVKAAEARAEEARNAYTAQARVCAARQETEQGFRQQMAEQLIDIPEENWAGEIRSRALENSRAASELKAALAGARKADERFRSLQAEEPKARRKAEDAAKARQEADTGVKTAEESLGTAEKELEAAAKGILEEGWTALDLSDALAAGHAAQQKAKAERDKAEKDENRLKEIADLRAALDGELTRAAEAILGAESSRSVLKTRLEERTASCSALSAQLPFPGAEACQKAMAETKRQKEGLENAITAARQKVEALNRAIAETTGQIKTLDGDLAGAPEEDIGKLQAVLKEKQDVCDGADRRKTAVQARRDSNERLRRALKEQADASGVLDHEYRIMRDVADTANGKVRGQDKVTLETYVQTEYFDRIINYANQRLIHMSRQQYDLARQIVGTGGRQGKTGLDLDVVDHLNGQRRAVSTLSGGEGFLASLSFALGMSDAIQENAASAVQLDTMFVDEGFGSLSENYLSLVMDELNDTADSGHRLIGIISHVDEVKEGIDRGIEVTKSESGISTARIY